MEQVQAEGLEFELVEHVQTKLGGRSLQTDQQLQGLVPLLPAVDLLGHDGGQGARDDLDE